MSSIPQPNASREDPLVHRRDIPSQTSPGAHITSRSQLQTSPPHTQRYQKSPGVDHPTSVFKDSCEIIYRTVWVHGLHNLSYFILEEKIATSSFGAVFKARSTRHKNPYAINVLNKKDVVSNYYVDNINRKASVLLRGRSPFLCYGNIAYQDIDNLYIIMNFAGGGDLSRFIHAMEKIPESDATFYAAELFLAISYFHTLGAVHRTITPENILITHKGHLQLSGFGSVERIDVNIPPSPLRGKPTVYTAPEVAQQFHCTETSDYYSLGVIIFELLTGRTPTGAGLHWDEDSGVSDEAKDLITKLLCPEPWYRLGSAACGGIQGVMNHPWFKSVDWYKASMLQVDAPYQPILKDDHDTFLFGRNYYVPNAEMLIGGDTASASEDGSFCNIFPEFQFWRTS